MQRFSLDEISQMEQRYRAAFINSLSGFKSANLVGTQSAQGVHNLALVSSVFHLGASPALMGMIIRPHTVRRDTLENIMQTGFYTINHVNALMVAAAHQTSARYDANISEFDEVGLSPQLEADFPAPYVLESHIKIGLRLEQIQPIAINQTELLIGAVEQVIIDDETIIKADGYVDIEAVNSVAISSLDGYHSTQSHGRFHYAKANVKPSKLID